MSPLYKTRQNVWINGHRHIFCCFDKPFFVLLWFFWRLCFKKLAVCLFANFVWVAFFLQLSDWCVQVWLKKVKLLLYIGHRMALLVRVWNFSHRAFILNFETTWKKDEIFDFLIIIPLCKLSCRFSNFIKTYLRQSPRCLLRWYVNRLALLFA